jgi:Neuraminidase (sialidase)
MDTVAKENLMALSADGQNAFAVWLDLRDKHNKIFGAKSSDGGKTWGKNIMIYASPDTTVCECCKPSVVIKGNNVYGLFRNWLNGNRDLHIIQSTDGGLNFGQAQKLGTGS